MNTHDASWIKSWWSVTITKSGNLKFDQAMISYWVWCYAKPRNVKNKVIVQITNEYIYFTLRSSKEPNPPQRYKYYDRVIDDRSSCGMKAVFALNDGVKIKRNAKYPIEFLKEESNMIFRTKIKID